MTGQYFYFIILFIYLFTHKTVNKNRDNTSGQDRKAAEAALITAVNTNHKNFFKAVTEQNTKCTTINHNQLSNS